MATQLAGVDFELPEHFGTVAASIVAPLNSDTPRTTGVLAPCIPAPLRGVSTTVAVNDGALELLIVAALRGAIIIAP